MTHQQLIEESRAVREQSQHLRQELERFRLDSSQMITQAKKTLAQAQEAARLINKVVQQSKRAGQPW
jgi:demethoxyubiquinone hydroxylase (CLK1/Coq7/Cat5 family)